MRSSPTLSFTPPRWVGWFLAIIPVFPALYAAALGALPLLRGLPLRARQVLFFFAATQLVAALFTPQPLLSLGLAAARTLVILAMIAAGVYLREGRNLRPLLWGQLAVCLTAWVYTVARGGVAGVQDRLGHPYYFIASLGLTAVVALWLTVFWRGGALAWRVPAGLLAFATFAATGSRGALLALGAGSLAALALGGTGKRQRAWLLLPGALVLGLAALTSTLHLPLKPIERLLNDQTTGREYVWQEAVQGWRTSPLGGVGPYQGGTHLTYLLKDGCLLTPSLERSGVICPAGVERWSSLWMTAHNVWLHALLESGLIGLSGLLLLTLYTLWRAVRSRDSLLLAVLLGFTAMNLVDVVTALPSQHFAELWWVAVGLSLLPRAAEERESETAATAAAA